MQLEKWQSPFIYNFYFTSDCKGALTLETPYYIFICICIFICVHTHTSVYNSNVHSGITKACHKAFWYNSTLKDYKKTLITLLKIHLHMDKVSL